MLLMPAGIIALIILIMLVANQNTSTRKDVEVAIFSVKYKMVAIPLLIIGAGLLIYGVHFLLNFMMPEPEIVAESAIKINGANLLGDLKQKINSMMLMFVVAFIVFCEAVCSVFLVFLYKKLDTFKEAEVKS